jgi:hypothetical protein
MDPRRAPRPRNDLFEIFKEGAAGVPQLLKKVAGELTGGAG